MTHKLVLFLISLFLLFVTSRTYSQNKIVVEKLPPEINTPYHEVSCVISKDGKKLFFTRNSHPQNVTTGKTNNMMLNYPAKLRDTLAFILYGMTISQLNYKIATNSQGNIYCSSDVNQDIWIADITSDNKYKIFHPGSPVNTANNNSVCCALQDNKVLLFGEYEDGISRTIGYSTSIYGNNNNFSQPNDVVIENYYLKQLNSLRRGMGTKKNAYITGPVLIFSETLDTSYGTEDIYVSFYKSKFKHWSEPINIGSIINSKFSENRPFLTPDTKTLFFSSNKKGNYDIYFSQRLDDSWTNWTTPVALPYPVNTPDYNDGYLYKNQNDNTTYFCSDRDGSYDIFKFDMPANFLASQDLKIAVFDKIGNTEIKADMEIITNSDTTKIEDLSSVNVPVPTQNNIAISIKKDGYLQIDTVIIPSLFEKYDIKVYMNKIAVKEKFILNDITFYAGTAETVSQSSAELSKLYKMMTQNLNMIIEIEGHTNNIGNKDKLVELSLKRAQTIKNFLVKLGIDENRIKTTGYGGEKPIFSNDDPEKRKLNQRVEVNILQE